VGLPTEANICAEPGNFKPAWAWSDSAPMICGTTGRRAPRAAGRRWTGCRTPAGGPLTYTWSNRPATTATATYTWQTPGIYTVNASATNWCRSATASLQVTVFPGGDRRVFLPLVLRK
jgi:hypothetical protein